MKRNALKNILTAVSLFSLIFLTAQPASTENSSASYSLKASQFSNAGAVSQTSSYKVVTATGIPFAGKTQGTNYTLKLGGLYLFYMPAPPQVLSVSVEPKLWDIGSTEVSQVVTMGQANKITVTNNGTGPQTYELKLIDPTGWTASSIAGNEQYVLSGLFCSLNDTPQASSFSQDALNEDVITQEAKKATNTVFCYSQSTANGVAVPAGSTRGLYLQFKSPTITQQKGGQDVAVIVSAQVP